MKIKLSFKIIISIFLILLLLPICVFATNTINSDEANDILAVYQTDYEYVASDLFLYDTNIEMSDVVDGNVFAYGSNVKITGEIYGDLFVFADSLEITEDGIVHGNVFTYAANITVSGIISDIYAMSDNFNLTDSAILARNLCLYTNTASLYGQVSRDAFISCESLTFGDSNDVIIKNNLNYTSKQEAQIPEKAVAGEINYTQIQVNTTNMVLSTVLGIIRVLIFSFVMIILSIWLSPKFKDRACEIILAKSLKAFGIGLLVLFITIIASIILLIFTYGFGISIALAAIALLVLSLAVSNTVFSMSIGKLLANKFNFTKTVAFVVLSLLIVLILELVKFIPYIGGPIRFITAITGLGILCINAYKRKDLIEKGTTN